MKKNFFKKLSFVLALAMIISMIAPAGAALAAAKPKLNATKKYLHLDKDGYDEFDFNIANKKDGWKYKWTSADKKVATVNSKNGLVEATGVGKTKITVVITDKAGKQQAKLSATVIVRDNIASLKITNTPDGDKLAVGKENDFNRSYVTVSGSSKKTSGITRWTVTPSDGATISDSGVFVATKAGEYTITARAFQSKAKYNSWLSDNAKYEEYVTATAEYTVKVAASLTEVKQTNLATFKMTFDTAMTADDVKKNTTVYYMVGDVKVKEQLIKEVKEVDGTDKKEFTVQMTDEFTPAYKYVVEYTDLGEKEFVAATTKVEDVAAIEIGKTTATIYVENDLDIKLLNKDGVVINQPNDKARLNDRITAETSNTLTSLTGLKLYMYNLNEKTTVKATFHTYKYDNATGKETVYEDSKEIVCVDKSADKGKEVLSWTIIEAESDGITWKPDFDKAKTFIALEDTGRRLFTKIKLVNKIDGSDEANSLDSPTKFKLTSSDTRILFVDALGYLYPAREGTVTITVEYNDVYVGSFDVVVNAKRKAATLELSTGAFALSNSTKGGFVDKKAVTAKLKDQFGNEMKFNTLYATPIGSGATINYAREKLDGTPDNKTLTFFGNSANKGVYQFKVYTDVSSDVAQSVTVTIQQPSKYDITNYRFEINNKPNDQVDMKVTDKDLTEDVKIQLFGYNNEGIKITEFVFNPVTEKYAVAAADPNITNIFTVTVKNKDNETVSISGSAVKLITPVVQTISGTSLTVLTKAKTGTYTVSAEDGKNTVKAVFNVADTQAKPAITKVSSFWAVTTAQNIKDAFMDKFEVKVGSTNITKNVVKIDSVTGSVSESRIYIKEVDLFEYITNDKVIIHTVPVGYYITVPANFMY